MTALLLRISRALPDELPAALWAFVYFFALLAGYYVLRPLRDEIAIQLGPDALHELFTSVFLSMLAIVPVFGWLTRRFERRQLLPWLYAFFIANLLGFYEVLALSGTQSPLVAKVFFVWVSVFNLFAISVFWSFMADLFSTAQAKRLVGFISAGGTAGALSGPVLTMLLVKPLGAKGLVLVSAALLLVCIGAIVKLRQWARQQGVTNSSGPSASPTQASHQDSEQPFHGSLWNGLLDVIRSPYLLGICAFLFCYSLLSTFLYFQQTALVPKSFSSSGDRTQLLAGVDLLVNTVTLLIQLLAFGTLIQRLGTRFLLVAMPLASLVGYATLAALPALAVLVTLGVVRRAGEYAISKPARETLFNVLSAEQKYRAKNVIDTLVHRTGDTSSAWIFNGLRGAGLTLTQISWLAVPISALWLGVAWILGGAAERRAQRDA
ncbi:MAG: MFS transporter [Burkholderiales bacterium]|nr:MFS transporter [Burkholderiales bacterium]